MRGNDLGKLILVAPAAFKGSFSPRAVADAIAAGVRRAAPEATVLLCPVADGGDGLLDAVLPPGSLRERVEVSGPLGMPVAAELGWVDPETAILESSTACGLALLPAERRDPLRTTTRGVGELLWEAALADLATWASGWGLEAQVIALADVTTPLLGPEGAAPVFGPQKGATPETVARLAAGLERLAGLMAAQGHPELATLPGGGAAGGLGAGLVFFAGAQIVPGAAWVLDRVGFDAALAQADLVVTGEGALDRTSRVGKATGEVIRRAQAARKVVAVVAGRVDDGTGLAAYGGDGATLDAAGIATLAERATRDALGLPASPAPS